ncbi:LysE family translocator [Denitrobaculum tricleocarpae]|uniref:LysE family translocator n=1 Tax=Denitrobaculum tricleocarpae TaxID=2591009 RepID=A0A545T241_9PROT|nr:LysE family translocator [Denitrobaculum tricleocarpae]TQV71298.1 LysE family translocator [Denitrobaculum tricleocarpae]
MDAYLAIAGLITVAVITPGPNNFIVLERAHSGGWRAAAPAIMGVVAGTQLLLLVIWLGVGALITQDPRLQILLTFAGAGYLCWLGLQVIWRSFATTREGRAPTCVAFTSFGGMVLFQFLNPKSWVLVLTATAAVSGGLSASADLAALAFLFLVVPGGCLMLWAFMGMGLTRFLAEPRRK